MSSWRVILQLHAIGPSASCEMYDFTGVVSPARIAVVACDPAAETKAQELRDEIDRRLVTMGARPFSCGLPRGLNCQGFMEPSCHHVLVLVIGSATVDPKFESMASDWMAKSPGRVLVMTALIPPLDHKAAFGSGAFPKLSKCAAPGWNGSVHQLAQTVLSAALLDERPGVFVSYLRAEASAAAEDLHDALVREGFRVFLDRFSGTPGRIFPHELAESMASMGLVLLLETTGLRASRWTMWEAAFASRYRLGPLAVRFGHAPTFRAAAKRLSMPSVDPNVTLPSAAKKQIVDFARTNHVLITIKRQIYYEALVRLAARSKGGEATVTGPGVLELRNAAASLVGSALPTGTPARLRHVKRLVDHAAGTALILAGEHQNLAPGDHDDLRWLAQKTHVRLAGSASVYHVIRRVL